MIKKHEHNVTLNRLILEGFGCYRQRTEFIFSPGINCYVAENEAGKTTMVAGLIATLFGLKHHQKSASPFTLDRFRNWDHPHRCCGEVYFTVGEEDYLIRRDFDTHRVELWSMEDGSRRKELIVEGVHNPGATKRLQEYEDKLLDLLGLNSQELFGDTFCLGQPLPEPGNISVELQGLLAGGKGTSFHEALDNLVKSLKSLTRFTGPNDRGITARNQGKDGQLELLAESIEEMERKIGDGRQKADSLLSVQEQLIKTEEELRQTRKELVHKEKIRGAWSEWRALAERYRHAARERDKLQQVMEQAQGLHEKITRQQTELERLFPAFISASAETGEHLTKLDNIETQFRKAEETVKELEESLQENNKSLQQQMEAYDRYAARELLGADPVDKLKYIKRSAENCRQQWAEFRKAMEEKNKIDERLKNEYAPFEDAAEEELDMAREYNRRYPQLKDAAEKARRVFDKIEAKMDDYREARSKCEDRYADLQGLPEDAAALIEGKLDALKKKRELEDKAGEKPVKSRAPLSPGGLKIIGALVLAAIAGAIIGPDNIVLLIAVVAVAGGAGYWLGGLICRLIIGPHGRQKSIPDLDLQKVRADLADYDRKLGAYASWSEAELGRLAERLQHYKEERRRLEVLVREIAAEEEEMEELRQKVKETKEELNDYKQKTVKFTVYFEDISIAYAGWQHLLDRKQTLQEKLRLFAAEKLGCSVEEAETADPRAEGAAVEWRETARFLRIAIGEAAVQQAVSMIGQVNSLIEEWWMEQENEAEKLARIKKEIEETKNMIRGQEERLEEEKNSREKLQEEKTGLLELLPGILESYAGDAAEALAQWKEWQQRSRDKNTADIELKTILESHGAAGIADLQGGFNRSQDHVGALLRRWQDHITQNLGLPGTEQADDPERVTGYLEKLKTEIDNFEEQKNVLEDRRNDLSRQQASLEGENPLNIAAAELELRELKQEKEKVEINADALTLAYKELEEAINEYRQTYKERLENQASAYCQNISSRPGRTVKMDDSFNIGILEDGRHCTVEQISKGARDQLYLSLRFALADLLAEEIKLPLIFDDPFTSTDARRLENIREILHRQEDERQFIIVAHADTFSHWGKPIKIN
ncbi:MAG: AAA family ATPase [Dethiobacteria bacterium]